MILRFPWRVGWIAMAMLAGGAGGVLAHALPGSVLLLQHKGADLQLTIQFPLEDLIIAAPDLAALEDENPDDPLSQEMMDRLTSYLVRHLLVSEGGAPLPLILFDARLQSAYHDHLGHFMLVVSQWDVAMAGAEPASLMLKYDAVMHEVRNHRATVQWLAKDGEARQISEFGFFRAADGIPLDLLTSGRD